MKNILFMSLLGVVLAGCQSTSNIKPSYVSPTQYQHLTCQQVHAEYQRVNQYIQQNANQRGSDLGVSFGLGGGIGRGGAWGLFPSVSITPRTGSRNVENRELAKLYGQQDALVQAAQFKNCPIAIKK